jgi:hypothetical protein
MVISVSAIRRSGERTPQDDVSKYHTGLREKHFGEQ